MAYFKLFFHWFQLFPPNKSVDLLLQIGVEADSLSNHGEEYILKNEFDSIVKHVRRERRKKQEEKVWESFLLQKKQQLAQKEMPACKISKPHLLDDEKLVTEEMEKKELQKCQKNTTTHVADAPATQRNAHKKTETLASGSSPHNKGGVSDKPVKSCRCQSDQPNEGKNGHNDCRFCKKVDMTPKNENGLLELSSFDQEFKRVEDLRDKITFTLKTIEAALGQEVAQQLDEDEAARSKMRNAEFAARFKRNYHYQIDRQINEVKKLSSSDSSRKTAYTVLLKKFKSSYLLAVQALQSAEKHFRLTSDVGPHLWLHDFLTSVNEMANLFSSISQSGDKEEQIAFKTVCSSVMLRLESLPTKQKKQVEYKKKKTKKVAAIRREGGKDNLWMYRNPRDWKAKASELVRLKQFKMNKKKAAEAQVAEHGDDKLHLQPLLPDSRVDLKMEVRQREGSLLRRQVRSVKEDQVRTMMEILPDATDSDREDDKVEGESANQVVHPATIQMPAICSSIEDVSPKPQAPRSYDSEGELLFSSVRAPRTSNVHLINIQRDDNVDQKPSDDSEIPTNGVHYPKFDAKEATQYRKALQFYQRKHKWYDPLIIESIDRVTERIFDELMRGVVSEINIDHIISGLIELELQR